MLRLPDAEFLDEILTKVLKVFLLAIYSHIHSFAMRFLFLSNSCNLLHLQFSPWLSYCTCTGNRRKEENLIEFKTPFLMV
jgi:hypothetical protein